jgi:prevent-host-death family protein
MVRANITEIKNRLSHYLRLVQGGDEVEIVDRKTPLAKLVGISGSYALKKDAPWVKKMHDLGVVMPPKKEKVESDFSNLKDVVSIDGKICGVLDALREERETGR